MEFVLKHYASWSEVYISSEYFTKNYLQKANLGVQA